MKKILSPPVEATCHLGPHERLMVDIKLQGRFPRLPDAAVIPQHLSRTFKMYIFDYTKYKDSPELCPADDIVCESLATQGVWESFDTLLMLDILDKGDKKGLVVDFGSHVGWYSIIAALAGYSVLAFDTLAEYIKILKNNAQLNKVSDKVTTFYGWVDEGISIEPAQNIRFMKVDIEGNEQYAFKMYEKSFKQRLIDYAIFEISPCFNDSYPKLIHAVMDYGYKVYQVPPKRWHRVAEFNKAPLETTLKYPIIQDIDQYLNVIRQEDFLFVRQP